MCEREVVGLKFRLSRSFAGPHELLLYPLEGDVGSVLDGLVEEVRQDGDDGQAGDGRRPRPHAGVLHVRERLLGLSDGGVDRERGERPGVRARAREVSGHARSEDPPGQTHTSKRRTGRWNV